MRSILLVGGAPRVAVDAVRYMTVAATGATAVQLKDGLQRQGLSSDLLLSVDASPASPAERYEDRAGLALALKRWIQANPTGVVVMSAAINDYDVSNIEVEHGNARVALPPGAKLPSRAGAVIIHLKPSSKVIDLLRTWGLTGPIVGFKYEARETVLQSATAQCVRVGASLVVANSLCGQVQALVNAHGHEQFPNRPALLDALRARLVALAHG
jgi:hypothetical protein